MKTNKTGKCKIMEKKNSKRVRGSGCKKEITETEKAEAKAEVDRQGETEREGGAEREGERDAENKSSANFQNKFLTEISLRE